MLECGAFLYSPRLYDGPIKGVSSDEVDKIWATPSSRYAEDASGKVLAFVGEPRKTSVFLNSELPILLSNPAIPEIDVHTLRNGSKPTFKYGSDASKAVAGIWENFK